MTFKLVHVKWFDSQTHNGWCEFAEIEESLEETHTVGLLAHELEAFIVIAHSYDPTTEEFNGAMTIPRSAINSMRTMCRVKLSAN